jgi:hypothetical protein
MMAFAVPAAAVFAAYMSLFVIVVMAHCVWVKRKRSVKKGGYRSVGAAGDTRVYLYPGLRQGLTRSPAETAAYKRVHAVCRQKAGQRPVAASVCRHDRR